MAKIGPQQLTYAFAEQVREAFGPDSIIYETMTEEDVQTDWVEYMSDKRGKGNLREWIDQHIQAQRIHFERANEGLDLEGDAMETMLQEQREFIKQITQRTRQLQEPAGTGEAMAKTKTASTKAKTPAKKSNKKTDAAAPATPNAASTPAQAATPAPAPGHVTLPGDEQATTARPAARAGAAAAKGPQVGQTPGLMTDAELTDPRQVAGLSDFQWYVNLDAQGRVVARSFLAKVTIDGKTSPKRQVFELRTAEQAASIKPGQWRVVPYEWYAKYTVEGLKSAGYPAWNDVKAQISPKTTPPPAPAEPATPPAS